MAEGIASLSNPPRVNKDPRSMMVDSDAAQAARDRIAARGYASVKDIMDLTGADFNTAASTLYGSSGVEQRYGVKVDKPGFFGSQDFQEDPLEALRSRNRAVFEAAGLGREVTPAGRGEYYAESGPVTLRSDMIGGDDPYLRAYITAPGGLTLTQAQTAPTFQETLQRTGTSLTQADIDALLQQVASFYGSDDPMGRGQQLMEALNNLAPYEFAGPDVSRFVSLRGDYSAAPTFPVASMEPTGYERLTNPRFSYEL